MQTDPLESQDTMLARRGDAFLVHVADREMITEWGAQLQEPLEHMLSDTHRRSGAEPVSFGPC